jgi:hypothetical protein
VVSGGSLIGRLFPVNADQLGNIAAMQIIGPTLPRRGRRQTFVVVLDDYGACDAAFRFSPNTGVADAIPIPGS